MEEKNTINDDSMQNAYDYAAEKLVNEKKNAKRVVQEMIDLGIPERDAQNVVDEVRKELKKAKNKKNLSRVVEGIVFLALGIVATAVSDKYVYTGAIGVGGILLIIGLCGFVVNAFK